MSRELEPRNQAMYQMYAAGKPIQAIADTYNISRQRAAQIIARYAEIGVSDNDSRSLARAQLDYVATEMLKIVSGGPVPAYNVKGEMLRDDNDNPVADYTGVLSAADTYRKISESIRRMDALDLPRRKQIAEDIAMAQVKKYLASLPKADVIDENQDPFTDGEVP